MGGFLDLGALFLGALFWDVVVEGENGGVGEVAAVGFGDGGHQIGGMGDSAADEEPSGGLGDEGEDEEEEEEGGNRGGDVEMAPWFEGVGYGGEEGDAGGEEVEGGHSGDAALGGADGLGGEDEGAEADAAGAESGEEAEECVDPVVGGKCCGDSEYGVQNADHCEGPFSS